MTLFATFASVATASQDLLFKESSLRLLDASAITTSNFAPSFNHEAEVDLGKSATVGIIVGYVGFVSYLLFGFIMILVDYIKAHRKIDKSIEEKIQTLKDNYALTAEMIQLFKDDFAKEDKMRGKPHVSEEHELLS